MEACSCTEQSPLTRLQQSSSGLTIEVPSANGIRTAYMINQETKVPLNFVIQETAGQIFGKVSVSPFKFSVTSVEFLN